MRVVGIGGGHGLAQSLLAARLYADEISAVVTVADDGGSSGRLSRELGIPPPGDIRNCLVALSEDPQMARLYQHRFAGGALTGHTVGNLLIAALTEMHGDFAAAVAQAGKLLKCRGKVYPATTALVGLGAKVSGGTLKGQVAVAQTAAPIQAVYLSPSDPPAHGDAVEAVKTADQILLGPGSLFTSLIATLIVPGIRKAIQDTSARRIFICNTRMQKGETDGLDAAAHVDAVQAHAGAFCIDTVVVQSPRVEPDGVVVDRGAVAYSGVEVIEADIADAVGNHDPERLARELSHL
jgi:uncharacterized cofD-like protein